MMKLAEAGKNLGVTMTKTAGKSSAMQMMMPVKLGWTTAAASHSYNRQRKWLLK